MLPPVEIADSVEKWARQQGRHARLFWQPMLCCFCIEFELRADDPRLRKWQDQTIKLGRKPSESVPLHSWDPKEKRYVAWDLEQRGVSGMIEHLDRANLLSGRGEHNTLWDAMKAVEEQNQKNRRRIRNEFGEVGREVGWLSYRTVKGNPTVTVGVDTKEWDNGET